jgi:hypothetical protein
MRSLIALYFAFLLLTGCGITPQSYDERVAAAYATVAITNDTTTTLVLGGTISKDEGRKVLEQTRTAREAIDVAGSLSGQVGEDKLLSALNILRVAQDLLCAKNETDPNCVALRARSQP